MLIRIGDVVVTKSSGAKYSIQRYEGGSIGIRGRVQSEADINSTVEELYRLREGSTKEIQVITDDGGELTGSYKINELHWQKQRSSSNNNAEELVFNIGLQKQ